MKRIMTYSAALLISIAANAQSSVADVLRAVEQNNMELKANERKVAAQRAEDSAENNLPDPTLSYAHLWESGNTDNTTGEFIVSQSFDFPTLYAGRNRLNRSKTALYDKETLKLRQELLLQAKEVCIDIITLRKQQALLRERLTNAEELGKLYNTRLQNGDANIIEINKINLELLNVKTESSLCETALNNKLEELRQLNGGNAINLYADSYDAASLPADFETLKAEVIEYDPTVAVLGSQYEMMGKALSVNKQGWLPKLELGYRRDTDTGLKYNGVVMGVSIPIFENRGKVKAAKAQRANIGYLKENAISAAETELRRNYNEATALNATIAEYDKTLKAQQDIEILKQALYGGEISMIDYFVEATVVYQSKLNCIELESRYQKLLAQIYRSRL